MARDDIRDTGPLLSGRRWPVLVVALGLVALVGIALVSFGGRSGGVLGLSMTGGESTEGISEDAKLAQSGSMKSASAEAGDDEVSDAPAGQEQAGSASASDGDSASPGEEPSDNSREVPPGTDAVAATMYVEIPDLDAPETLRVTVTVHGWRDRDSRVIDLTVSEAVLMGAIDPESGAEMAPPERDERETAARLEGLRVLASVNEDVVDQMVTGEGRVLRMVLVPSGDGAVMLIDEVVE